MRTPSLETGAYGSGLVCGPDGRPLRPGGPELTEVLLDLARFEPGSLVVDVGCGQGTGVAALLDREVQGIGIDRDPATLAEARRRVADGAFLLAEAERLPFTSGTVDGILAECSLSTMTDRPRVLREWARVLNGGGRLAISDVYRRAVGPERVAAGTCLSPMMTWSRLAADLADAGFVIEWFEDCSAVLKNWVARFVFEYGSLEPLWGGACGLNAETVRMAAPGYFVLIADKPVEGRPVEREARS